MAIQRIFQLSATLTIALLLAGCAASADRYPSLAIRDVERAYGTFDPVTPASEPLTPAPPPAGEAERLQDLIEQAMTAHRKFQSAVPQAEKLVASVSESGPDSNSWAEAQVALAGLESQRSLAAVALGDLDLLYADASTEFGTRSKIDTARAIVSNLISQQDSVLADLRQRADQ